MLLDFENCVKCGKKLEDFYEEEYMPQSWSELALCNAHRKEKIILFGQGFNKLNVGQLAQWLERPAHNRMVIGSNPILPT